VYVLHLAALRNGASLARQLPVSARQLCRVQDTGFVPRGPGVLRCSRHKVPRAADQVKTLMSVVLSLFFFLDCPMIPETYDRKSLIFLKTKVSIEGTQNHTLNCVGCHILQH